MPDFMYTPHPGRSARMYWKMSIDLSRPLIHSMGQHDPLDGFITFSELQVTAEQDFGQYQRMDLGVEIAGLAAICRGSGLATTDPLSLGGLLADSFRVGSLMIGSGTGYGGLAGSILDASLPGVRAFAHSDCVTFPPELRLAFRELGLAIGLKAIDRMASLMGANPGVFGTTGPMHDRVRALQAYAPLAEAIDSFWLDERSRNADSWIDHREINMVMLATSLAPDGFLAI